MFGRKSLERILPELDRSADENFLKEKLYLRFRSSKQGEALWVRGIGRLEFMPDYWRECFDYYEREKRSAYLLLREKGRKWFDKNF